LGTVEEKHREFSGDRQKDWFGHNEKMQGGSGKQLVERKAKLLSVGNLTERGRKREGAEKRGKTGRNSLRERRH